MRQRKPWSSAWRMPAWKRSGVERNGGRRAAARGVRRLRLAVQRREQREAGGERGGEERAKRDRHEAGPFELATPRSIRNAPSRCCQCNRPSTSMPSSGAVEVRAARPCAAGRRERRPASTRSARTTRPVTQPPAVLERTVASPGRRRRSASAAGIATPVAPVSTRKSTLLAVQRSRPVIVAVVAAPDLDDAAGGREGRLLRLVLAPLVGDEDDRAEHQPDRWRT